jgi:transcriptional regulator with XRE-family HTH domain
MNLAGPNVAHIRRQAGITQHDLAIRCREAGWPVSRPVIAKVEGQRRSVSDHELVALALALQVPVTILLAKRMPAARKR